MADSSSNASARATGYYCHVCKCRVPSVTESFTCPNCSSGFIEEVENEQPDHSNDVFSIFSSGNELPNENLFNILNDITLFSNIGSGSNIQIGSGNPSDSIFRILSNVIGGGQANGGPILRLLHGNPEDYVWSTDGLDTVITQLLNQIDSSGPPPMSAEEISNLNEISVTKEHVNLNLQCPVCMEDFVLDEKVKELSCRHFFHNDCIVEWLKLHATCPTCRTNLTDASAESSKASQSANASGGSSMAATNSTSRLPESNAGASSSAANRHHQRPSTPPGNRDYDFGDDLD